MVYTPDKTYPFTISQLLEGFLEVQALTITNSTMGYGWNVVIGGVQQSVNITAHSGDVMTMTCTVKNTGDVTDNFLINRTGISTADTTANTFNVNGLVKFTGSNVASIPFTSFTMPAANVSMIVSTFHEVLQT